VTDHPRRASGWTKDRAGAAFAYAAAYCFALGTALAWTKRATPEHAYLAASLIATLAAFAAAWVAEKIMRRLPCITRRAERPRSLSLMTLTPYDDDRARYSRQGLARLVLSDHTTNVADAAGGLVGTRNDADTGPGGRVSQAQQLIELAEQALTSAVIYEVERGSSWVQIADSLGLSADEARERYTPALDRWNAAFHQPYRLDETGRKRIPLLPTAAYDPAWACTQLDQWAFLHHVGIDDRQAVSAGLVRASTTNEPDASAETE
jgi:hypothetical protein